MQEQNAQRYDMKTYLNCYYFFILFVFHFLFFVFVPSFILTLISSHLSDTNSAFDQSR